MNATPHLNPQYTPHFSGWGADGDPTTFDAGQGDGLLGLGELSGEDGDLDRSSSTTSEPDPLEADSDGDGISDYFEFRYGQEQLGAGSPAFEDSNGDGLADVRSIDSDSDGLTDLQEDPNADGVFTANVEGDVTDADGDDDQLADGAEGMPFEDCACDLDDRIALDDADSNDAGASVDWTDSWVIFRTDATDDDGDGLLDHEEGTRIAIEGDDFLRRMVGALGTST